MGYRNLWLTLTPGRWEPQSRFTIIKTSFMMIRMLEIIKTALRQLKWFHSFYSTIISKENHLQQSWWKLNFQSWGCTFKIKVETMSYPFNFFSFILLRLTPIFAWEDDHQHLLLPLMIKYETQIEGTVKKWKKGIRSKICCNANMETSWTDAKFG